MQKKLTWIDALRGIAILLVIAVHTGQHRPGLITFVTSFGQLGVQLFFIVSSITLCISASTRRNEPYPILNFYSRRIFRIAPAYWVGIFFYMFWSLFMNYHHANKASINPAYTPVNILMNIFFLHGFYPPANNTIVRGGWSIGTEMAFYAIFPLLWAIQSRLKLQPPPARPGKKLWLLPALSILLTSAILCCIYLLTKETVVLGSFLYYNIVNQLNVFIIGISAYHYLHFLPKKTSLALFFCFSVIGVVIWNLDFPYAFYMVPLVFAIAFAGLSLYFSQLRDTAVMSVLASIGKVSFSMYLFHFAVADMMGVLFHKLSFPLMAGGMIFFLSMFSLTVLITFGIAKISYRFVEQPGIAIGKRLTLKLLGAAKSKNDSLAAKEKAPSAKKYI